MGIFKDIVDTAKQADIQNSVKDYLKSRKYSSISKMASDGIMQFPVLVTRSLDIDTLQMINKALERNYATFVQVAISMNSTMNISKTKDPSEFIQKFHQNSTASINAADVMNTFDNIRGVTDSYNIYENENVVILAAIYEGSNGSIIAKNKEQMMDLMSQVRSDILNEKYVPKKEVIYNFKNKELSAKYNAIVTEAVDPNSDKKIELDKQKFEYQKEKDKMEHTTKNDAVILSQNILKDNDVKKSNELMATTLHVRVKQVNDKDENVGLIDFIVGIKATMHPIKSEEMITNMISACKNNDRAFNFFRWTTGEISFFKDFLFNIGEIKNDIVNKSSGASPWWISLKRFKALSKINASAFNKRLLPNATIVLSVEEAEFIKSEYGYDLFSPVFIRKIMDTYFLLGFVIVDNSSQIAHFMFAGRPNLDFESISFSGLEKENSSNERKFKEMLKVINRN